MKVVDMHCDTIAALYENKEKGWTLQDNRLHIRLDKMKQGDYLLQNFALFVCTNSNARGAFSARSYAIFWFLMPSLNL